MQDFVTDGTEHLLWCLFQKQEGLEKKNVFRTPESDARRSPQGQVNFFPHLEKEIAEEIVFIFHESQTEAADKRKKGIF